MASIELCICVFASLFILHLIHGNVIFDILESHTFQKYSTYWVFSALGICVFACLCTLESEESEKFGKVVAAGSPLDQDKH